MKRPGGQPGISRARTRLPAVSGGSQQALTNPLQFAPTNPACSLGGCEPFFTQSCAQLCLRQIWQGVPEWGHLSSLVLVTGRRLCALGWAEAERVERGHRGGVKVQIGAGMPREARNVTTAWGSESFTPQPPSHSVRWEQEGMSSTTEENGLRTAFCLKSPGWKW